MDVSDTTVKWIYGVPARKSIYIIYIYLLCIFKREYKTKRVEVRVSICVV